ncbi:MAG: GNAT family protein [Cognaticolwellia sp.]
MAMKIALNSQHLTPTLSSQRIYLRPITIADYPAIKVYRQDPQNCRYIRPYESDDALKVIVQQLSQAWHLTAENWNGLAICMQDDDALVGEIAFRIDDWQSQRAEIGYRLSEAVAGKGICTEAVNLLIGYLFEEFGFYKLIAKCDTRNIASCRVLEKLNFTREGFFKQHYLMGDEWTDQYDYGLLVSNWLESNHLKK